VVKRPAFVMAVLVVAAAPARADEPRTLPGNPGGCRALAYSPDGKLLASGGEDRKVHLWDTSTWKEVAAAEGKGPVTRLAFSPDGKILALVTGSEVWVIDVARATVLLKLGKPVNAVAFSADGRRIYSGGAAGAVFVHGSSTGRLETTVEHDAGPVAPTGAISSLSMPRGGGSLAVATPERLFGLGPMLARELLLERPATSFEEVLHSPDGKLIATSTKDGVLVFRPGIVAEEPRSLGDGHAVALAFSPDGSALACACADKVTVRNATSGASIVELASPPGDAVLALAFSPDGKTLATGGTGGGVLLRDAGPKPADEQTLLQALMKKAAEKLVQRLAKEKLLDSKATGPTLTRLGVFINETSRNLDMDAATEVLRKGLGDAKAIELLATKVPDEGETPPAHRRTRYVLAGTVGELRTGETCRLSLSIELMGIAGRTSEICIVTEGLLAGRAIVDPATPEGKKLDAALSGSLGPDEAHAIAGDLGAALAKLEFPDDVKKRGKPQIRMQELRNVTSRHMNTGLLTSLIRAAANETVLLAVPLARMGELKGTEDYGSEDPADAPPVGGPVTRYALAGSVSEKPGAQDYTVKLELTDMQSRAVVLTVKKTFAK
jgi:hypothetical protein